MAKRSSDRADRAHGFSRTRQCKACPWKKSTNPGEDIPGGYDPKKHEVLVSCHAGAEGIGRPVRVMACHESTSGAEQACVGWIDNQLGPGNNIPLRLLAMQGLIDVRNLVLDGEQYESLEEMCATSCATPVGQRTRRK